MNYSNQKGKTIILKTVKKGIQISIEDLIYIENDSYVLSYYLIHEETPIIISSSLKKVELELASYNFIRINRNQMINMKYFKSFDARKKIVTLSNASSLPISRRKLSLLKRNVYFTV